MEAVSETCCPATVEMLPESAIWLRRRGVCEFLVRRKMGSVRGRMYKSGHLYNSAVINSIQFIRYQHMGQLLEQALDDVGRKKMHIMAVLKERKVFWTLQS